MSVGGHVTVESSYEPSWTQCFVLCVICFMKPQSAQIAEAYFVLANIDTNKEAYKTNLIKIWHLRV